MANTLEAFNLWIINLRKAKKQDMIYVFDSWQIRHSSKWMSMNLPLQEYPSESRRYPGGHVQT